MVCKAKAADLKEMIQSELSPAGDSTKQSTPTVVRIRKVVVKNNGTVTPQIIVKDKVVPDPKVKVQIGQNEDTRVVGYGTLNGAKPLIIVDGLESSEDINPKDVDRVQVLKDASATKLYGDKGKNGVILVTTKKNIPKTTIDKSKIVIGGPNDAVWHENQPNVLVFIDGKEGSINDVDVKNIESVNVNRDFASPRRPAIDCESGRPTGSRVRRPSQSSRVA
jgi:TonB-dependent SusC/RagA subfamily outer membrane receptor